MIEKLLKFLFAVVLFAGISTAISAQTVYENAIDGKIYFKFKDDVTINIASKRDKVALHQFSNFKDLFNVYNVTKVSKPFFTAQDTKLQRTFSMEFGNFAMVDQLIRDLENYPEIEYAEKAPIFELYHTPNDYGSTGNRWHLDLINATTAWNTSTGSAAIKVAVIDNGIWTAHPDLTNKVVAQIDLGDNDSDPTPPSQSAEWSHGTHTSGLAVAHTNNNIGVSSIGYNCSLMAVKVARNSDGALVAGFEGIVWAADNGADVINMSWGSAQYFQTMQNIVDYAYSKGCVLVASAGNDGANTLTYPAALNNVISVGSVDGNKKISSFSQFGSFVDVMAPGGYQNDGGILDIFLNYSVYSTAYGTGTGAYMKMQGTSMSSPIVAGLCALMLSVDTNLTPDRLTQLLKASCTNINSQNPNYIGQIGAGLVNAAAAVEMVQDSISPLVANFASNQTYIPEGGLINFTDLSIGNPTSWQWSFSGGSPAFSNAQNPTNILYSNAGIYAVSLTVSDGTLSSTETKTFYITVESSGSSAWFAQVSGFTTQYRGMDKIYIVDPNTVWGTAINGSATSQTDYYTLDFSRTDNGGQTWTPGTVTGVPSTYVISSITATSYNKAWIACFNNATSSDKGGIFVTNNGGQTWTRQNTALYNIAESFPNVVHFWDNNNGWAQGDPVGGYFELYNTTDGGNNWVRTPSANIPAPLSGEYGYVGLYDVAGDTIWWGTNMGRIFISYDKGYNWDVIDVPGITDVQKVVFNDGQNGMLQQIEYDQTTGAISNFKVMKTLDGGLTWSAVDTTGMFKTDLAAVPDVPGMFVSVGARQGESGSSYTINSGNTWTQLDQDIQYISAKFLDGNTGWAGSFSMNATMGGVFKWKGLMSVSVSNMPLCAGDSINVNVNIVGSLNSGNTFTVELSDANGSFANPVIIGSVLSDVSASIACLIPNNITAGTGYRIRAKSNNPVNTTNDNGFNLTINNKPIVDMIDNASVCYTSNYYLLPQIMYHDSILWTSTGTGTFNNNTIDNPFYIPSVDDSTAGTIKIYLTAYSGCGITEDSLTLTLTTTAIADAGMDMTICEGETADLFATGGDSYLWNNAASLCCTTVHNPTASPLVTTTYTVTVGSLCGTVTDDVVVFVNPNPIAVISTNSPVSFCDGGSALLQTLTSPDYNYQWQFNGAPITSADDSLYTATETGEYTNLVTNNFGCSNNSNSIYINVNPLPSATVTASDSTVFCEGDSVVLTINTQANNIFEWYKDGTPLTGSNNLPLTVFESGNYHAVITDTIGCIGFSPAVDVTVNPVPAKPTITENNGVLFSSSLQGNQWYLDGVLIPGAVQRPYTPTGPGNYSVQVTNAFGCESEMSDPYLFNAINDPSVDNQFVIYPNPTDGLLYIYFNSGSENTSTINIYNLMGQLVYTQSVDNVLNSEYILLNLNNLSTGIYNINFISKESNISKKLIIE
ncbi:MAG: S8 family serine peptidase [Bacteroidales bacterium]|nr:S8 family serine peptidase [Bacteroidales bacterium]